jgi:hypothetical protein
MDKFEIGDKAIVIRSFAGNEGKIVEVLGFYNEMDFMYSKLWPEADLIVQSLGAPFNFDTISFSITPAISSNLKKLPKIKDEETRSQVVIIKETVKV